MTVPVAAFTTDVTTGRVPLTVAFTDTSTHTPTARAWDFGDGTTATSTNPSHAFAAAGVYPVTLLASNGDGFDVAAAVITVLPALATGKMAQVMDGLAALLAPFAANVYAWPADAVTVPCAIVNYPTKFDFDLTFRRGGDTMGFDVYFLVGKSKDRTSRDLLSSVMDGAVSIKTALDGDHGFGSVSCTDVSIAEPTVNAVSYLAAKFAVEVLG